MFLIYQRSAFSTPAKITAQLSTEKHPHGILNTLLFFFFSFLQITKIGLCVGNASTSKIKCKLELENYIGLIVIRY